MTAEEPEQFVITGPTGRQFDRRVGWDLFEGLYLFGDRYGYRLESRYYFSADWYYHWVEKGLDRKIDIIIDEGSLQHEFPSIRICSLAWYDDRSTRTRYYRKKPSRSFIVHLPAEASVLYQTLEWAREDALVVQREHLIDESPLQA